VSTVQAATPAASEVRRVVEEVLARPEFRSARAREPSVLSRFWDWLSDWLSSVFGISPAGAGQLILWVGCALLLAAAVFVLLQLWRAMQSARASDGATALDPHAERRLRVGELLERARAASAAGELALALRLYFSALVIGLGERGDLEYRDSWTNRELLERGRPAPAALSLLKPLVPGLDRKSFGHEPTSPADVEALESLCARLLRGIA
jgi:hypothetical protein